ncbi:hypothetical protein LV716_07490 [Flagellimonas sp. HMM57]|uniref:hypothetical protein n=1 Tax=unclassified Flagellimonas TaxID=2644544 RepID=UPI0013D5BB54|nr:MULTISPECIES: hypothetical protein [unclassified Flagellimonas]UII77603.1 hypothetical protein LV716_07490 [Flagellimonas sp. HMM57]
MLVAIHKRLGSFSDRWVRYCENNKIEYILVDCYSSDIIEQLTGAKILLWHWDQEDYKAVLFAKQLIYALEKTNITVFPSIDTSWHFDDKIGQKYLFETLKIPSVPSYVFFEKSKALEWAATTSYPKVFKLRGGAGAINVKLVRTKSKAKKLIKKSFGSGFGVSGRRALFYNRIWHFRKEKNLKTLLGIFKGIARLFLKSRLEKVSGKEKGYSYFQDFIPNNKSDIRIIVIGNRSFAIERFVRKGDFRASGSGLIRYLDNQTINFEALKIAFESTKKIGSQCIAFDFVIDEKKKPVIVEISYSFSIAAYDPCPGFWNSSLEWTKGSFVPQEFMLEDVIKEHQQA